MNNIFLIVIIACVALLAATLSVALVVARRVRKGGGLSSASVREISEALQDERRKADEVTGAVLRVLMNVGAGAAAPLDGKGPAEPTEGRSDDVLMREAVDGAFTQNLLDENGRLSDENERLQQDIEAEKAGNAALREEKEKLERERNALSKGKAEAVKESGLLKESLAAAEKARDGALEGKRQSDNRIDVLVKDKETLQAENKKLITSNGAAQREIEALKSSVAVITAEGVEKDETISRLKEMIRTEGITEDLRLAIMAKDRRIMQLRSKLQVYRDDLETIAAACGTTRQNAATGEDGENVVLIEDIFPEAENEDVVKAFNRVSIFSLSDIGRWSKEDLLCIPMVTEAVIAALRFHGAVMAEGHDEGNIGLIRLPELKHGFPDSDIVLQDKTMMTAIRGWKPKIPVRKLLCQRLYEYGIRSVGELAMRQWHEMAELPGIGEKVANELRTALKAENMDFGMSQSDLKRVAGYRAQMNDEKAKGHKVISVPAGDLDEVTLENIPLSGRFIHYGPRVSGAAELAEKFGLSSVADVCALNEDEAAMVYPLRSVGIQNFMKQNGLSYNMFPERRKRIVSRHDAYITGEGAAYLKLSDLLFSKEAAVKMLEKRGIRTLGDVAAATVSDLRECGPDLCSWLRATCRAHGLTPASSDEIELNNLLNL